MAPHADAKLELVDGHDLVDDEMKRWHCDSLGYMGMRDSCE